MNNAVHTFWKWAWLGLWWSFLTFCALILFSPIILYILTDGWTRY